MISNDGQDGIRILFRGKGYVVAEKPVGASSEDTDDESVPARVRRVLGVKDAFPCHRLDVLCGGCILVATDKETAATLSRQIAEGSLRKTYCAVCEGKPEPAEGRMTDLLFFDRRQGKTFAVRRERAGVKPASLSYQRVATRQTPDGRQLSLVRVTLETGRTHQIRAQFASRGMPLLGDGKYGSRDNRTRCALRCESIDTPDGRVLCPMPDAYPWSLFSE